MEKNVVLLRRLRYLPSLVCLCENSGLVWWLMAGSCVFLAGICVPAQVRYCKKNIVASVFDNMKGEGQEVSRKPH